MATEWMRHAPVVVGAVWAVLGGILVGHVMARVRVPRVGAPGSDWRTTELGYVERSVYFAATLAARPEVIAGWLVFKAAGAWRTWPKVPGVFNGFALGSGLSLAFGVAGGLLPAAIESGDVTRVLGLLVGPTVLCGLVVLQRKGPEWMRSIADPEVSPRSPKS